MLFEVSWVFDDVSKTRVGHALVVGQAVEDGSFSDVLQSV